MDQSKQGKKPQRPVSQLPSITEESRQSSPTAKNPQQPPTDEKSTQGSSKGKTHQDLPFRPKELPTQSAAAFKVPSRPASQQPLVEGTTQSTLESKASQKKPSQQPARSISEGKKPQGPSSHQLPTEGTTQGSSKGKQPMRPSKIQPIGVKPKRGKCRHKPLEKDMEAFFEQLQEFSEFQMRHDIQDEQASSKPSAKGTAKGKNAKGKQPMPKEVFGNPKRFIVRIPVGREASIERVLVSIGPDTAFRHPQTFFFKNIPSLEPYWGYLNDKAFTAQRIVRLYKEEGATPYFLMVSRGEHPKVKSPRNDNLVFAGLYEPIFNDAFVFKLGEPEVYKDGYAKYVHIEEDIDSLGWLPQAIRDAAKKVEFAMARNANPGFPDMDDYADEATMSKDEKKMLDWQTVIRKAEIKYGNSMLAGETTSELPNLEGIGSVFEQWAAQVTAWRFEDALPSQKGWGPSDYKNIEDFVRRSREAMEAVLVAKALWAATASTDLESSEVKLIDAMEKVKKHFFLVRDTFIEIEAIANGNLSRHVYSSLSNADSTYVVDVDALKKTVEEMEKDYRNWKAQNIFPPGLDNKIMDNFSNRMRAVVQALNQHKSGVEVLRLSNELKEGHEKMMEAVERAEASMREDDADWDSSEGAETAGTSAAGSDR